MSSGAASKLCKATHFGDDHGNIFGIQAKGADDGVTQRQKCHGERPGIRRYDQ
jgi:hypothetical protein